MSGAASHTGATAPTTTIEPPHSRAAAPKDGREGLSTDKGERRGAPDDRPEPEGRIEDRGPRVARLQDLEGE